MCRRVEQTVREDACSNGNRIMQPTKYNRQRFYCSRMNFSRWSIILIVIILLTGTNLDPCRALDPRSFDAPPMRRFLKLPTPPGSTTANGAPVNSAMLRVLQFNVLADGLAGLREDFGYFSRAGKEQLDWEIRKNKLLHEIVQYKPDVITMQEVDHYYDFFLPEFRRLGYAGYFSPKPTSACLQVSNSSDGCAMFINTQKLRVLSCETRTLALSKAELTDSGELKEEEEKIRTQNQVALIAVCELIQQQANGAPANNPSSSTSNSSSSTDFSASSSATAPTTATIGCSPSPPILIGTTHLKSAKSATGERYRQLGIRNVLEATRLIYQNLVRIGRTPAVILTGDLNAVAENAPYDPLCYRALKADQLGLRSVYNEDITLRGVTTSHSPLYTTWKKRDRRDGRGELEVKRCIDYICYRPFIPSTRNGNGGKNIGSINGQKMGKNNNMIDLSDIVGGADSIEGSGVEDGSGGKSEDNSIVIAYSSNQIAVSLLLRFAVYFFGALIPLTSLLSDSLTSGERMSLLVLSLLGIAVFELTADGSIFRPVMVPLVETADAAEDLAARRRAANDKDSKRGNVLTPAMAAAMKRVEQSTGASTTATGSNSKLGSRDNPEEGKNRQKNSRGGSNKRRGTEEEEEDTIALLFPPRGSGVSVIGAAASSSSKGAQVIQSVRATLQELANLETLKVSLSQSVRQSEASFLDSVATLGQQWQPLPRLGSPGFEAHAAVDVYSEEQLGEDRIPSDLYPSDHLAIVADLRLLWE